MIVIHGGVAIDSTRVDEVEEKAGPFQAASRAEAGCVEYQLSWKVGEVASLRLLEIWADEESYVAHTRAAHTAEWSAFVPGAQFGVRIPARAARSAAPRSVASNSSASASHDSTVTTPSPVSRALVRPLGRPLIVQLSRATPVSESFIGSGVVAVR